MSDNKPWQGNVSHGDGILIVANHLKAGETSTTHTHRYGHFTILAQGSAVVSAGDEATTLEAPACIEIKAGLEHDIAAITDTTWYCVHATTGAVDPEVMALIDQADSNVA